ncbi:MAG: site-specific integrase [Pseudomonadota bacterium]
MKTSANLWLNRHGTWYFRAIIPKHLRNHFPDHKREVRRSLQTDSKRLAIQLARECRVALDKLLEQLEVGKDKIKIGYIGADEIVVGDAIIKGLKIDHGDPEKEQESLAQITSAIVAASVPVETSQPDGPPLTTIIEEYCAEQVQAGNWKPKTEGENRAIYNLLVSIVKDQPITDIKHETMQNYKKTLRKLPANMNKNKRYRDKRIKEILAMDNVKPMSTTTINKNLTRASSLLDWATRHGYISQNFAHNLTIGTNKRAIDDRDPFSIDELQTLFNGYLYQGKFPAHTVIYIYQYWLPLLGLFTGARIEELCKPCLDDIREIDSIWCLDVKDAKTEAGERLIPIHQRLVDLGFIDYVDSMKEQGEEWLFPELHKGRDGKSQSASKWFARYRKRYSVGSNDGKKCFHSFRHNVKDCFKHAVEISENLKDAVMGHHNNSMSARYGSAYKPSALIKAVKTIDYPDLDLSHVSFSDFLQRKNKSNLM